MAPYQTFISFTLTLPSVLLCAESNPSIGHSMLATKHASAKVNGAEQMALTSASSVDLIRTLAASPSDEELEPALLEGLTSVRVTPEVFKVVSEILDGLSDTYASILKADKDDTGEMETLYKQYETIDSRFTQKESELKGLEQAASGARSVHRNCRNNESSLVTRVGELSKELDDLHTDKQDKARIADGMAGDLTKQLDILRAQGTDAMPLDFLTELQKTVTNYGGALQTHIDSAHAHKGKLAEKEGAERVMEDKNVECDKKQMIFENSVCSAGAFSQGMCETYTSSYDLHSGDYQEAGDNVKQSVTNRKKAWSHFKLVECFLTEIKQNFSVDLKCHEKKEENPELDITIKPPLSRRECPVVPPFPCSDAFSQQEYSDMPADVTVKCTLDCQKDSSEATTPAPTSTYMELFHNGVDKNCPAGYSRLLDKDACKAGFTDEAGKEHRWRSGDWNVPMCDQNGAYWPSTGCFADGDGHGLLYSTCDHVQWDSRRKHYGICVKST